MSSLVEAGGTIVGGIDTRRGGRPLVKDLRPAGKVIPTFDESTKQCLDFPEGPPTPGRDRKWRSNVEAGVRIRHPGLRDDPVDEKRRYGVTSKDSLHVEQVFPHGAQTEFGRYIEGRADAIYKSVKSEPLGKSLAREGHALPPHVGDPTFAFGGKKEGDGITSKDLIFPVDKGDETFHDMYRKTHGSFEPGEQRRRNYDWKSTGVTPDGHRFGRVEKLPANDSVAAALNPETDEPEDRPRRVVPKRVDDARQAATDHLGRAKNLGRGTVRDLPMTYGLPPPTADEWGAADCIRGDYSVEEQMPDADVGRSTRPGFRNLTTDADRRFGVPSIRTDIPARKPTVAASVDYGSGVSAGNLVNPARYSEIGVGHKDFTASRKPEEIRDVFEKIGYKFTDAEFNSVWKRAAEHYDINGNGIVSVEEFRLAINELDDARDDGKNPSWFG